MSVSARLERGERDWRLLLPLPPVPASRPRVGRWGTYYLKTYKLWRDEVELMLGDFTPPTRLEERPVYVGVYTVAKRPKTLTRPIPRGDVDNFAKATLDAVTRSGLVWRDDNQVQVLVISKRYAEEGEIPHTFVHVSLDAGEIAKEHLPAGAYVGEDIYDLEPANRVSLDDVEM